MVIDLSNIDSEDNLKNFKIIIEDETISMCDYEKENFNICSKIANSDRSRNLIIHTGGIYLHYIYIIMVGLTQYFQNMNESSNNIMENLEKDDMVYFEGTRVRYKGTTNEILEGREHLILEYKDGSLTYIVLEDSYKVQKYNGSATQLNKMSTKKSKKIDETKSIISEIFNIDVNKLNGILKYSAVIVSPKNYVFKLMDNLKIEFNNKVYNFSYLIPSAYYSSIDNLYDFKGNYSKGEPLIKFVSKISTAKELAIRNKESVKSIIIFGEELYKNTFHELEQIINRKSINEISILLEWSKISTLNYLMREEFGFKIYAWSRDAILNRVDLVAFKDSIGNSSVLEEQYRTLENYVEKGTNIFFVDFSDEFNTRIIETRKHIKFVAQFSLEYEEKDLFVKIAYCLIVLMEKSCFPLKIFEEKIDSGEFEGLHPMLSIKKLESIKDELEEEILNIEVSRSLAAIIENLKTLREMILHNNPKLTKIREFVYDKRLQEYYILFPKIYWGKAFKYFEFRNYLKEPVRIIPLSRLQHNKVYNNLIIPAFFDNKGIDIFNNCYVEHLSVLLYPSERGLYLWKKNQSNTMMRKISKNNCLVDDFEESTNELEVVETNLGMNDTGLNNDEIDINVSLNEIIDNLIHKNIYCGFNKAGDSLGEKVKCVKTLIFENDEKILLTKHFKLSIFDRDNENIVDKHVEDVCVGDEMIFVKGDFNEENNIVEEVINSLLKNEEFRNEFEEKWNLSKYWRIALKNYMDSNGYNEIDICKKLKSNDVSRTPVSIMVWLKDNRIIGPREAYVFDTLALVTEDEYFIENCSEIYTACNEVRTFQTKLKKSIAKSIEKSITTEGKNEFDLLVEDAIGELSQLANVLQIRKIIEKEVMVPINIVNKLIED